jgi:hypothetical protein
MPAEFSAFKSLATGKSALMEQSGRSGAHCDGGSMMAFSRSTAAWLSPQPATAIKVATHAQMQAVCRRDIIVKLLTIGGNYITAYRRIV